MVVVKEQFYCSKNSADEKNCADGAKLCTNETEPSASKDAESARMFCGIMNLPPPPTKFSKYSHILLQATRETCEHSMAEAVRKAVDENDGKRDLAVAVDGSWQKRGFSSKNGLVTVTSVDTGKVIDVEVFSKHCICRTKPSIFKIPGDYTVQAMECLDKQRLLRAKFSCLQKTKEVRKEKILKRKKEDDELLKNADDLEYGAGMF
ncbi:uncharacterized protein TNCV_891111 [Trichonephila clavipes]|nr:uncharacterized protein TNCV_891111 [Trichonephila clavipes]